MSTPERQQDVGEHGYAGVHQEKQKDEQEHPLDDPQADPREPAEQEEDGREQDA